LRAPPTAPSRAGGEERPDLDGGQLLVGRDRRPPIRPTVDLQVLAGRGADLHRRVHHQRGRTVAVRERAVQPVVQGARAALLEQAGHPVRPGTAVGQHHLEGDEIRALRYEDARQLREEVADRKRWRVWQPELRSERRRDAFARWTLRTGWADGTGGPLRTGRAGRTGRTSG